MQIAGCTWGLSCSQAEAADAFVAAGLDSIDVDPGFGRQSGWEAKRPVSCLAAGHLIPGNVRLDDEDVADRVRACDHIVAAFAEAARLGAEVVYVGAPNAGDGPMRRFADVVVGLADKASEFGLVFAVEPSPPRGLRTIAESVRFIETTGLKNLHVLLDFAHCLLVNEDPVAAIDLCGSRLAYVHFNDTDGKNDNHLGLTDGIFDRGLVTEIVAELRRANYRRPLAIESSPTLPDPLGSALTTLRVLRECGA